MIQFIKKEQNIDENLINSKVYQTIQEKAKNSSESNKDFNKTIQEIYKDIGRTFHVDKLKTKEGQDELGRVLTALAFIRPEIGYCQGMNFVAGALLSVLKDEELSFWVFVSLLDQFELNSLYVKVLI